MNEPRGVFCRFHCCACDRHFTSFSAFNRHRAGDREDRRYCENPAFLLTRRAQIAFEEASGSCINGVAPLHGVRVWSLAGSRERARERFGKAEAT